MKKEEERSMTANWVKISSVYNVSNGIKLNFIDQERREKKEEDTDRAISVVTCKLKGMYVEPNLEFRRCESLKC